MNLTKLALALSLLAAPELAAGPTTNATSGCSENPRMRPACATDVAGGIVEVAWQ